VRSGTGAHASSPAYDSSAANIDHGGSREAVERKCRSAASSTARLWSMATLDDRQVTITGDGKLGRSVVEQMNFMF
jgi:hypothetical protein